jgi:hypothetical protein
MPPPDQGQLAVQCDQQKVYGRGGAHYRVALRRKRQ